MSVSTTGRQMEETRVALSLK